MFNYTTWSIRSHNENGNVEIEIERDATLWEILCRMAKGRTFDVSIDTTEIFERGDGWYWMEKDSGEVTTVEMANLLNHMARESRIVNQLRWLSPTARDWWRG